MNSNGVMRLMRVCVLLAVALGVCASHLLAEMPAEVSEFAKVHCVECHQGEDAAGEFRLAELQWNPDHATTRSKWIEIFDRVQSGEMPPESPLPDATSAPILTQIWKAMSQPIAETQRREGRTSLRRLNRREFENSLHDLLGIDVPLKHLLPVDSHTDGFDTVADGLRISAVQIEKYFEAIDVALDAAIRLTAEPKKVDERFSLKNEKEIRENIDKPEGEVDPISGAKHKQLFYELDDALVYISHGYSPDNLRQFNPTADGHYRVRVSAYAVASRGDPIFLRVYASDWKTHRLVSYFEMLPDQPRVVEFTAPLTMRDHLRINGHNIGIDADGKSVWNVDTIKDWKVPGLAVQWVEVQGPLIEQWPPDGLRRLVGNETIRKLEQPGRWTEQGHIHYELASDDAQATARRIIESFATRAFRRPLATSEAESFVKLGLDQLAAGASLERSIRVAVRSILASPQFLFLNESSGALDEFALASRLSYFFWSSMPDDELMRLAAEHRLSQPDVLEAQVNRLLDSPRAAEFVTNFVGQWLDLNQIDATTPDLKLYPEYDEMLRASMVGETEAFFRELLRDNLPISNVIDSDFVMLDQRLSDHYHIPLNPTDASTGFFGEQFRRVLLSPEDRRGGLMTQAAVLKVTANGTVTSPVTRGAWILRHILGTPPSPPPPVITAIEPDTRGATTIREQLDKHRDSETCNRCHSKIDPPGFALEAFDVIGGYRDRYRSVGHGDAPKEKLNGRNIWEYKLGLPVDCTGHSANGKPFRDIEEFKQMMLTDQTQVLRNLTKNLVTYGTGAGVSFADRPEIERMLQSVSAKGSGLRTLVHEVVRSELFRHK